ncbi:MAG: TauD/TfdA family dioxygenase [Alphaproteobacteria bacterium]|nr:TauD/TfdA family dioxygenase [Alphaproteobacteria bacterium]
MALTEITLSDTFEAAYEAPYERRASWQSAATPPAMGDLYQYDTEHQLCDVRIDGADPQLVHLHWSDGWRQTVHALWLREQCTCAECRHPASLGRILDQDGYDLDDIPALITIESDQTLMIIWADDGHISRYQAGWLRHGGRPPTLTTLSQTWGAELAECLPRFDFAALLSRDDVLLEWLEVLRQTGLTYVTNAPTTEGTVCDLVRRIANIRETNFGSVFEVVALADSISNAYTAAALPLHVDLPAREYQPGLQFLHCLANQTSGGNSIYCDGLQLAKVLREEDVEAFATLLRTPVLFRYHDQDCDYQNIAPIIELAPGGGIRNIRFNPAIMTTADCAPSKFKEFQRAYRSFLRLTRRPDLQLETRMEPGEIAVFDNRRVLHGRRAFAANGGSRHLQGAYVEWEDVDSRIRVLRRHIG